MTITSFIFGFLIASFIYDYLIKIPITLLCIRFQERKQREAFQKLKTLAEELSAEYDFDKDLDFIKNKNNNPQQKH